MNRTANPISTLSRALAVLLVCWCSLINAQVPRTLSYQGYLTSPSGAPINNASLPLTFNLYSVASGGTALHSETQSVNVINGIFNALIGSGTPLTLAFDQPYFVGISAGGDPEMAPRQPLTASPYAIRSASSESLAATALIAASNLPATQLLPTVACANNQIPQWNGSAWICATASLGNGTVTNVGTGAGLTGGPITATGTISIAPGGVTAAMLASNSCGSGQVLKWNGSAWVCAADDVGGGTVTNVATGAGLTGGPITATGTVNLTANQLLPTTACLANQIPKWSGTAWGCAADNAGPVNAFVQGGNAFGAPTVIGTTDAQPVTVQSGGTAVNMLNSRGDGLRIEHRVGADFTNAPATINGHRLNTVAASASGGTISGGGWSDNATNRLNTITGGFGSIGGGSANSAGIGGTVAGGTGNTAGYNATVSGGDTNTASGFASTVAGGAGNRASANYTFAAGTAAWADLPGTFVWADGSTTTPFKATVNWLQPTYGSNTFNVRATGGVLFATSVNTSTGVQTTYCYMGNSGTGWICSSDRNVKERIEPITPSRVLAGVLAMPVSTWSIIGSKLRQMGPMAQDFYREFGLGDTDKAINSIDASGVAFAAIQGLNQKLADEVKLLRAKLSSKDEEARQLKANTATLAARLAAIEKKLGL